MDNLFSAVLRQNDGKVAIKKTINNIHISRTKDLYSEQTSKEQQDLFIAANMILEGQDCVQHSRWR